MRTLTVISPLRTPSRRRLVKTIRRQVTRHSLGGLKPPLEVVR